MYTWKAQMAELETKDTMAVQAAEHIATIWGIDETSEFLACNEGDEVLFIATPIMSGEATTTSKSNQFSLVIFSTSSIGRALPPRASRQSAFVLPSSSATAPPAPATGLTCRLSVAVSC